MVKFTYKVKDPQGMHARPAGIIAARAKEYQSDITVKLGEETVDMKKVLPLMGLPAKCGDELSVSVWGEDEDQAAEGIRDALRENF